MAYYNQTPQFYPPTQMGYGYTLPNAYSPNYNPSVQQSNSTTASRIICEYVQGEEAAKSFPVAPGVFAVLLDIEKPVIYTKTTDQYGRPQPIKILDYVERKQTTSAPTQQTSFVTKDDFDSFKNEMRDLMRQRQTYKKHDREEQ